ncbi:carbonic anhydrase [Pontibacter cellulosilyticus]|uniref:Uncharacterized protein n=1 Tax=Pontibacter cellulosilyticus TaxID=1720253 RepID=A0A923SJI1_9BACT|nr:carbonic anhydrase [Pontibacter cellulosilyticus]MBC5993682.1 hypothetical protein [Pontibacter cellulosilyticus]
MKNKLFLICPHSKLEHFLGSKYKNAYFLTALAAAFKLNEHTYIEELIDFIERESVEEVIVVNDVDCQFIESVLSKKKGYGTYAEEVLVDLLIDNYAEVMSGSSVEVQKEKLAELNVQRQIQQLLSSEYFLQQVVLQKIKIKGLIASTAEGKLTAVKTNKAVFSI